MILNKLTLENFGAYRGVQIADLSPRAHRPVILFGGMNGEGKTTILDAIQLALYGPRAKLSNRGRRPYRDYLRDSIHRGITDPGASTSVQLDFARTVEGVSRSYQLVRQWYASKEKGVVETVSLMIDGRFDQQATEHWDEEIEAYLPSGIAHLFFFDGEQVKELAEGGNAGEIVGTAIRSLLGLDIVDRLDTDLRVFERRKKAESLGVEDAGKLESLRTELQLVDEREATYLAEEGSLRNEIERLQYDLSAAKEAFRKAGGEQFERQSNLEIELRSVQSRSQVIAERIRGLVAGNLPMGNVLNLLRSCSESVAASQQVEIANLLVSELNRRDAEVLAQLQNAQVGRAAIDEVVQILEQDREERLRVARRSVVIEPSAALALKLDELTQASVPDSLRQASELCVELSKTVVDIQRIEAELIRVPSEENLADIQARMARTKMALAERQANMESLGFKLETLRRQRASLEASIDRLGAAYVEATAVEDDRQRMLRHSEKVRSTLVRFRSAVIQRHAERIEALMLECFQRLLRKPGLVTGLRIDPETFEPKLLGQHGQPLPMDRLSAGERQLLATAMLWGLAQASGRPIPTVIDTPLGRLDSAHRTNLIERYFPNASHQVILLSTDEEIVGNYHEKLKSKLARTYLLAHDPVQGATTINSGYFE